MTNMDGKLCVVTGATAGIGEITARELAGMGAHVVIIARSEQKAKATCEAIRKSTGNPKVEYLLADMSSLASVLKAAEQFKSKYSRLDVLVNNAGAIFTERYTSPDGYELTFATNHLGPFLFTNLLLDVIKKSAPARIVNVSSDAHHWGKIDLDDLQAEKGYRGQLIYGATKLYNILFTVELAKRLEGSGVTVNALHPGVIASNFGKNTNGIFKFAVTIGAPFITSPEKGAETSIFLASSPDVEGVTGQYFHRKKPKFTRRAAKNPELARKLWEKSEELAGLTTVA